MTTAEIGKFLVVCTLAAELYFPTYYGPTPSKDSKLTKEATHHKANAQKILSQARKEITGKKTPSAGVRRARSGDSAETKKKE